MTAVGVKGLNQSADCARFCSVVLSSKELYVCDKCSGMEFYIAAIVASIYKVPWL